MGKGKVFVEQYEANARHIQKSYNEKYCGIINKTGSNKITKKKKRKK